MPEPFRRIASDGTIWERIASEDAEGNVQTKKLVEPGDFHWCAATGDAPDLVDASTPPHVCMIWRTAEDQSWTPPEVTSSAPPSIEELIRQAQYTEDLNRVHVLGVLYQARALERIAEDISYLKARWFDAITNTESATAPDVKTAAPAASDNAD